MLVNTTPGEVEYEKCSYKTIKQISLYLNTHSILKTSCHLDELLRPGSTLGIVRT